LVRRPISAIWATSVSREQTLMVLEFGHDPL
jgi:hypothetical protein